MRRQASPELRAAMLRAALIELVIFAIGWLLYAKFDTIWALIVPVIIGSAVFLFFVAQAGGFDRRDDGR